MFDMACVPFAVDLGLCTAVVIAVTIVIACGAVGLPHDFDCCLL
jgi:hypothetical protein